MSGLEIMLWVWTGVAALLSGHTLSLMRTTYGIGWRVGLAAIAALELLAAAMIGSWAVTVHLIRLALQ